MSENQGGRKVNRKRQSDDGYTTRNKFPRLTEDDVASSSRVATVVAENVSCVCFLMYQGDEEDTDWIQCIYSRWLHKDCIDEDDIIHDVYGRELFCPYCVMLTID